VAATAGNSLSQSCKNRQTVWQGCSTTMFYDRYLSKKRKCVSQGFPPLTSGSRSTVQVPLENINSGCFAMLKMVQCGCQNSKNFRHQIGHCAVFGFRHHKRYFTGFTAIFIQKRKGFQGWLGAIPKREKAGRAYELFRTHSFGERLFSPTIKIMASLSRVRLVRRLVSFLHLVHMCIITFVF